MAVHPALSWPDSGSAAVILVSVSFILLSLGRGLAWLVDKGLGSGNPVMLDRAVMVALSLALIVGLGSYLRILLVNQVAERVMADIRQAIYDHVLYLPTSWFEAARTGDILSRLNTDTAVVQTTLASTLSMAVRNIILLFGGLVLVVLASARMSLVVAVIVPIVVIPLIVLARRLRASSRLAQERLGSLSAEAEEGDIGYSHGSCLCPGKPDAKQVQRYAGRGAGGGLVAGAVAGVAVRICIFYDDQRCYADPVGRGA